MTIKIDGVTKTIEEWSTESGTKVATIWARLSKKWKPKDAVFRSTNHKRMIEVDGEILTAREWSARTGVSTALILGRTNAGWDAKKAVYTPREEEPKDTLCWDCANCYGGCSWSREFKPVKGWTAIKTKIPTNGRIINSFNVRKCPEFVKDGRTGRK